MATYIPNATQTTEPVESRTVESAALEFRTLKASINGRIDAEEAARRAADSAETSARIASDAQLELRLNGLEGAYESAGVGGLPGSSYVTRFSGDGVTTTFYLDVAVPTTAVVDVYINGVYQHKNTFTVAATALTFSEAPPLGAGNIEVVYYVPLAMLEPLDSSLVSYALAGAGAVARTVQDKLREFVSVKDFGAVGDGVADDTAAIQAAVNAAKAAGGGTVHIPAGTYVTTSTITIDGSGVKIRGDGMWNTTITRSTDHGNTFIFTGNDITGANLTHVGIADLRIRSTGLTTSGAHVRVRGATRVEITRIFIEQCFIGFAFEGMTAAYVSDIYVINTNLFGGSPSGRVYMFFSNSPNTYPHPSCGDVFVSNFNLRGNTSNQVTDLGILILSADGIWFQNGHVGNSAVANIRISGSTAEMLNLVSFVNVMADEGLNIGVQITGNSPAVFNQVQFSNCIIKSGGAPAYAQSGIAVNAGCTIRNLQFSDCQITEFGKVGVTLASTASRYISFNNCFVYFNGRDTPGTLPGYSILNGVQDVSIIGGLSGGNISQSYGIQFGGIHTNVLVSGVDLTGNATAAINGTYSAASVTNCSLGAPPSVASASVLNPPVGHTMLTVTGTTTINSIQVAREGTFIVLRFDGALTVTDSVGNIRLAGNFVTAENSTLALIYLNGRWNEVSRSSN